MYSSYSIQANLDKEEETAREDSVVKMVQQACRERGGRLERQDELENLADLAHVVNLVQVVHQDPVELQVKLARAVLKANEANQEKLADQVREVNRESKEQLVPVEKQDNLGEQALLGLPVQLEPVDVQEPLENKELAARMEELANVGKPEGLVKQVSIYIYIYIISSLKSRLEYFKEYHTSSSTIV